MQLFCPNLIAFECGSSEFLISNYIFCLALAEDEDYLESNLMHGINGYLYANLPDLEVCLGDKVSWHLIGLGNEVDMHTAYFYGNTFSENGQMKDTVSLLPGNEAERKKESDARLLSFSLIFCSGHGKRWNQTVINRCLLVKLVSICNLGAFYMFGFNLATPRREQISLLYPPTPRGVSVSFCPQQNICGAKNGIEVRGRKRSSPISSRLCTSRRTCFSFPLLSFFLY